ncbi:Ig-like domain-containing protein [Pseudobutyrivibrio xylanivorans]|uniref:Ig-like domain (Group 2) n=1 Tax=Pseudobutyrivibrio xylanivorans TaxID=185007 RepID=A0A1G5RRX8_PSEXY|nr:Ig-like domain-containing protein [Pseudobutyrivibrio xylanivorans]SCZ76746.1 Ig-like domain (group 2) [Pseudobutyrivibrio xylanivorans]
MKKINLYMKNIMALGMAVLMLASFIGTPITAEAAKKKGSGNATYAVGDDIAFGHLDGTILSWTILTYDDTTKMALVTTRKPLNSKSVTNYRTAIAQMFKQKGTAAGYVRWSENYWRGWLNQTFYKECFNDAERAMIKKTTLSEQDAKNSIMNYYHDTSMDAAYVGGQQKNALNMAIYNSQTTTSDYVFFLSSDEYTTHKDTMKNETLLQFPLRTNSYDDPTFGLFGNDTDKLIYRMYYYAGDSIRPAMNVKLGEVDENTNDSSSKNKKSSGTKTDSAATTTSTKSATTSTTSGTATTTETKAASTRTYANNGTNVGDINLPEDSDYSMRPGGVAQVAIDMDYLNSTDKQYNCTYTTSDANVFTVDSNGQVTAVGKGSANVTVRMKKSNGKIYTMSCRIDVN